MIKSMLMQQVQVLIKFKGEPKEVSAEASSSSSIAKVVEMTFQKSSDKKDTTTINFRKNSM